VVVSGRVRVGAAGMFCGLMFPSRDDFRLNQ